MPFDWNAISRFIADKAKEDAPEEERNKFALDLSSQPDIFKNSELERIMQQTQEPNPEEPKAPEAPITNTNPNPAESTMPSANTVASNYDVSSGNQPSTMKMEGQVGSTTPPPAPAQLPGTENIPPVSPSDQANIPPAAPTMAPEAPKPAAKAPVGKNPLDAILDTSNPDFEARKQFEAGQKGRNPLDALTMLGAGVGDAISNAASAFGAKGTTGGMERTQATQIHRENLEKEQFDAKLLNDPNSGISQHYKEVLSMMIGKPVTDPKIAPLSAAQIKQTLPEVDKFVTHQIAREANEASKSLAFSEKQTQFDDRQWERLGAHVNNIEQGSRKALGVATINNMRADRLLATSDMKVITPQVYNALVADLQGIYKGGVPDEVMMRHGDYKTLQQKAAEILQMVTGKPQNVNTPEIKQYLLDLTRDIKQIDNKVINDNLGINAVVYRNLIKKDPGRWEDLMSSVRKTTEEPAGSTGPGTQMATPASATGEVKRKTANGKVAVFDAGTKQFIRYE